MEKVQVEVKIELGHKASCKKNPSPEGFTHDWQVFVRGPGSDDISQFVEKVVFHLHESFFKPKRVLKNPPYVISEQGYGGFYLPIEVYFKNKIEPRKLRFDYDLILPALGSLPIDNIRSEALTFTNPTDEFRRKLVKGGGIVKKTTTTNGFHSSSSLVNGTTSEQSIGTKDTQVTSSLVADVRINPQVSSLVQDPEKNKKIKHEGTVANKTVKTQEAVTPGLKRSASTSGAEETQVQLVKKKKKKLDEGITKPSKGVGFIPLELPGVSNESKDRLEEMKDIKLKIKSLSSKSPATDKKKNRRASSEAGLGDGVPSSSKRRESTSKKAKKKSPKEDLKPSKPEEKKIEKITFRRRGSGDSWSSSTSSSSLLGNSGGNTNVALDKLMADLSDEDDDDDSHICDISTPFQSKTVNVGTTQKSVSEISGSPNCTSQHKDTGNKLTTKGSSSVKKLEGKKNELKSPTDKNVSTKQSPKQRLKDLKKGKNGQRTPSSDLLQLYKRLVALKDSSLLQKIVDILEKTGHFELTETTLDFDLCSLDKTTIKKIENSISR
ncbi:protein AF-9-like [Stylophora pistillata]|uniref:Protein AF-9 n=1 Tax=Stylophora pistillata TaxID=50429 RepID=A0A2B4SRL8_STYPI|nr:protein AF-9-like [Stylophora pistillata]PFX31769.1 Protein AF-9 [Stylophora pistillata]